MNDFTNFFKESNFSFETCGCTCSINTKTTADRKEKKTLAIFPDESLKIKLAYQPKYGLVKVSEKNGATTDIDVLSELLKIKDNDMETYKRFFEKFGFLFPIEDKQIITIEEDELYYIVTRLKVTLELLSQLSESGRKNYKKITHCAYWLIANNKYKLDKFNYSFCPHTLIQKNLDKSHPLDALPRKYTDETKEFVLVKDFGYGEFTFEMEELYGLERSNHYEEEINDYPYTLDINCITAYINHTLAPYEERILIEFYFHCHNRIRGWNDDESYIREGCMKLSQLDPEFKKTALEAAKIILSEEISHYIKNIHPQHDYKTMRPSWKVDSLISALYYSLFFINPNVQTIRRCANVNCNRHMFFTVTKTSSKKIYCCPECCRNVQQRKHREKVKLNQTEAS